jgi:hypothetical protein
MGIQLQKRALGARIAGFRFGARKEGHRTLPPLAQTAGNLLFVVPLVVLTLLVPQANAQRMDLVTAIRMAPDPNHKMVGFRCLVNDDRRRYICLIDSGATNTIVSDRIVKAEGPVIEIRTGNGVVRVHQREVSLTIADGLELKSNAFIQSMMLQGVDILVGQDVLRQFKSVIFDYENAQVEFRR